MTTKVSITFCILIAIFAFKAGYRKGCLDAARAALDAEVVAQCYGERP